MMRETGTGELLLTAGEIGRKFRVSPRTVVRWSKTGSLTPVRTRGNSRRYRQSQVLALLEVSGDNTRLPGNSPRAVSETFPGIGVYS